MLSGVTSIKLLIHIFKYKGHKESSSYGCNIRWKQRPELCALKCSRTQANLDNLVVLFLPTKTYILFSTDMKVLAVHKTRF